jgi:hypothetical protein
MRVTPRIAVVMLLSAFSVFVLLCVGQSFQARYEAERLKSVLAQIAVGVTTEQDARKIFKDFRAENDPVGGRVFDTVAWGPGYAVSNRGLKILHVAEPTSYYVGVVFSKGIVVRKIAGLRVGDRSECCFFEVTQSSEHFTDLPPNKMQNGLFVRKEDGLALVHVDYRAPSDVARAAFDFNLGCLTSVSGCTKLNQVLPNIDR